MTKSRTDMTYKLPLATRMRLAADKRRRYWDNPENRLGTINRARGYRGAPSIETLDELGKRRPVESRQRDNAGRFAPDAR